MDCDDGIADVISEEIGNNSDCKYSSYRQEHPLESMKKYNNWNKKYSGTKNNSFKIY